MVVVAPEPKARVVVAPEPKAQINAMFEALLETGALWAWRAPAAGVSRSNPGPRGGASLKTVTSTESVSASSARRALRAPRGEPSRLHTYQVGARVKRRVEAR